MKPWIIIALAVAAIGAALLGAPLAGWLRARPDRAADLSTAGAQSAGAQEVAAGPFIVAIAAEPTQLRTGDNRLTLRLRDDQRPIEGASLALEATLPPSGGAPALHQVATMADAGGGAYRATLALPKDGSWQLRLRVRTVDGRAGEATLASDALAASAPAPTRGIAYYTCSMHPSVRSKVPGTCPICGMTLTAVTAEEVSSGVIFADAERRQLIGVTTGRATIRDTERLIRAAGWIAYAEPRLHDVALRFPAWIGRLDADAVGQEVRAGQPLFTIYSPELLLAQRDFLLAQQAPDRALALSARDRLGLWGLAPSQITALAARGAAEEYVAILSPCDGVVAAKDVVQGSALEAGRSAMRIADLSEVWIEAALYEDEVAAVTVGVPATVAVEAYPGERWQGSVSFISPFLDDGTRTARVRVALANPGQRLKPGMYATVQVRLPLPHRLLVPEDAVIRAGETSLVFLDLGGGKLRPQHVATGAETADGLEVTAGLADGDVVVTHAAFLLASESRLKSGTASW